MPHLRLVCVTRPPPGCHTYTRVPFCLHVCLFFVSEVCNLSLHKLDTLAAAAAAVSRERNRDVYGGPAACRQGVKFFLILLQEEEEEEEEEDGREGERERERERKVPTLGSGRGWWSAMSTGGGAGIKNAGASLTFTHATWTIPHPLPPARHPTARPGTRAHAHRLRGHVRMPRVE